MSKSCHTRQLQVGLPTPGNPLCALKTDKLTKGYPPSVNYILSASITFICGVLLWTTGQAAVSEPIEPLGHINKVVVNYLQQRLQHGDQKDFNVRVGRLDSRLRLAKCNVPLQAFLPTAERLIGKVTVAVECPTGKHWKVYVSAQVDVYEDVMASTRPILRGQSIDINDVQVIHQKASKRSQAYFHKPDQIVGMIAKYSIPVGKVFSLQMVEAPRLVQRGEIVTLVAETASLVVRMKGKALSDGAAGDVIKVRNTTSNRVVEGIVSGTGTVKVKM